MPRYPDEPGYERGNESSREAAESMQDAAPSLRRIAARLLLQAGPDGLTSDELEELTGWRHQTASARLRELVLDGTAFDVERRRRTSSGRFAGVRVHFAHMPTGTQIEMFPGTRPQVGS